MKIYLQVLTSSIKPQIWLFHFAVLMTTAKKWTKMKNARAERLKLLFLPVNMKICDVLVAVAVVVATRRGDIMIINSWKTSSNKTNIVETTYAKIKLKN